MRAGDAKGMPQLHRPPQAVQWVQTCDRCARQYRVRHRPRARHVRTRMQPLQRLQSERGAAFADADAPCSLRRLAVPFGRAILRRSAVLRVTGGTAADLSQAGPTSSIRRGRKCQSPKSEISIRAVGLEVQILRPVLLLLLLLLTMQRHDKYSWVSAWDLSALEGQAHALLPSGTFSRSHHSLRRVAQDESALSTSLSSSHCAGRRSRNPRLVRSRKTTAAAARQRLSTSQAARRDPGTEGLPA